MGVGKSLPERVQTLVLYKRDAKVLTDADYFLDPKEFIDSYKVLQRRVHHENFTGIEMAVWRAMIHTVIKGFQNRITYIEKQNFQQILAVLEEAKTFVRTNKGELRSEKLLRLSNEYSMVFPYAPILYPDIKILFDDKANIGFFPYELDELSECKGICLYDILMPGHVFTLIVVPPIFPLQGFSVVLNGWKLPDDIYTSLKAEFTDADVLPNDLVGPYTSLQKNDEVCFRVGQCQDWSNLYAYVFLKMYAALITHAREFPTFQLDKQTFYRELWTRLETLNDIETYKVTKKEAGLYGGSNKMARIFIREKPDGFYVMTYKGPVRGPFPTYAAASASGPSLHKSPTRSRRRSPKRSKRKSPKRSRRKSRSR